jgi:hypothetical protein
LDRRVPEARPRRSGTPSGASRGAYGPCAGRRRKAVPSCGWRAAPPLRPRRPCSISSAAAPPLRAARRTGRAAPPSATAVRAPHTRRPPWSGPSRKRQGRARLAIWRSSCRGSAQRWRLRRPARRRKSIGSVSVMPRRLAPTAGSPHGCRRRQRRQVIGGTRAVIGRSRRLRRAVEAGSPPRRSRSSRRLRGRPRRCQRPGPPSLTRPPGCVALPRGPTGGGLVLVPDR